MKSSPNGLREISRFIYCKWELWEDGLPNGNWPPPSVSQIFWARFWTQLQAVNGLWHVGVSGTSFLGIPFPSYHYLRLRAVFGRFESKITTSRWYRGKRLYRQKKEDLGAGNFTITIKTKKEFTIVIVRPKCHSGRITKYFIYNYFFQNDYHHIYHHHQNPLLIHSWT